MKRNAKRGAFSTAAVMRRFHRHGRYVSISPFNRHIFLMTSNWIRSLYDITEAWIKCLLKESVACVIHGLLLLCKHFMTCLGILWYTLKLIYRMRHKGREGVLGFDISFAPFLHHFTLFGVCLDVIKISSRSISLSPGVLQVFWLKSEKVFRFFSSFFPSRPRKRKQSTDRKYHCMEL